MLYPGHRERSLPDAACGVVFQGCWFYHLPSGPFFLLLFSSLLYSALDCVTYDNEGFRVFSCPRSCRHRITLLFLLHRSSPHLLRPIHLKTCHYKIPTLSSHPPLLSSATRFSSSWMPRPFFEFSLGSHVRTPGSALATAPPTIERRVDVVFPTCVGFVVEGVGRVCCVNTRSLGLHCGYECGLHLCPFHVLRQVTLWLFECTVLYRSVVMSTESRSSKGVSLATIPSR